MNFQLLTVQERLKIFRNMKQVNQSDFAETLGMSRSNYAGIESGNVQLMATSLIKLIDTYHLNPLWLLTGVGSPELKEETPLFDMKAELLKIKTNLDELIEKVQ